MAAEVVVPLGDAGFGAAFDDLERRLETVLATGPRKLVLDLAAVDRVSSTTVALLLWARRRCASQGVDMVLRDPSPRCRDTLRRTGLLRVMKVEPAGGSGGVRGINPNARHW